MMQIVIELREDTYDAIKRRGSGAPAYVDRAILGGVILSKGHGRLIDADELDECKEIMNTISGESKYAVMMDDVRDIPAIIPADRDAESEGV